MSRLRPQSYSAAHARIVDAFVAIGEEFDAQIPPTTEYGNYLVRRGPEHSLMLGRTQEVLEWLLSLETMSLYLRCWGQYQVPFNLWRVLGLEKAREGYSSIVDDLLPASEKSNGVDLAQFEQLDELTAFFQFAGLYQNDLECQEWMLKTLTSSDELEPEMIAARKGILAGSLQRLGQYEKAKGHFENCLTIQTRIYGSKDLKTVTTRTNLALNYYLQGAYGEAESIFTDCVDVQERILGLDHSDTLSSLGNLALIYSAQGRDDEAELLYLRVLKHEEALYGAEHPLIFTTYSNLAVFYKDCERFEEAEDLMMRALSGRRRYFGCEHPDTLVSLNNLAFLHCELERFEDAEACFRDCHRLSAQVLGLAHPRTVETLTNLAFLCDDEGRDDEAERIFAECLRLRERVLGTAHPDTLKSLNNLCVFYQEHDEYVRAEELAFKGVEPRQSTLGSEHPDTLQNLRILANCVEGQLRFSEAERIYVRCLEAEERVFGTESSEVADALKELAWLHLRHIESGQGRNYFKRAIKYWSDPDTTENLWMRFGIALCDGIESGNFQSAQSFTEVFDEDWIEWAKDQITLAEERRRELGYIAPSGDTK